MDDEDEDEQRVLNDVGLDDELVRVVREHDGVLGREVGRQQDNDAVVVQLVQNVAPFLPTVLAEYVVNFSGPPHH